MTLSLGELLVFFAFGLGVVYFLGATRVRELALSAVQRASREGDFQLLDQSVHIRRISLSRDSTGRWRVWRQYRFDYSLEGVDRRQGVVTMLGPQLQSILVAERASEHGGPTIH
jgi:hypothetical protein